MENKLVSMTEFVINSNEKRMSSNPYNERDYDNDFICEVVEYAEFLKQPLALWMIVPVDEDGNILKEPDTYSAYLLDKCYCEKCNEKQLKCDEYHQAQSRVLFEGFKVGYNGLDIISAWNEEITLVFSKKTGICEEYKTIEEFANSNRQPKLTKNPII
ncbi:hypothetical protein HZP34_02930 [Elizabethkingia anophelis]|nr:hypothetical protein [Elizabethkingia anophelis]